MEEQDAERNLGLVKGLKVAYSVPATNSTEGSDLTITGTDVSLEELMAKMKNV